MIAKIEPAFFIHFNIKQKNRLSVGEDFFW